MDVAYCTVKLLHRYLVQRDDFVGHWILRGRGFREVVEAKLGHRVTTQHTTPNTTGAHQLERRLRQLIADDPGFGVQLWMTLKDRLEFAIYLTDREVLFDPDLLERDAVYAPPVRHWWQFAAVTIGVTLLLVGVYVCIQFLT